GLQVIADILTDRSDRPEGQGMAMAPGDGRYHVASQIAADRYYAAHLLGDLRNPAAVPILIPLLQDKEVNDIVPWALGEIGDNRAAEPAPAPSYGDAVQAEAGRCARRKERIWRTASGIRSLGSFHGNMLTSAFGASIAASMAMAYGCAGISSGKISTGVWHFRTKSRVTVKTKSGLVRYILVRNLSTISIVMSGRRAVSAGPQPFI